MKEGGDNPDETESQLQLPRAISRNRRRVLNAERGPSEIPVVECQQATPSPIPAEAVEPAKCPLVRLFGWLFGCCSDQSNKVKQPESHHFIGERNFREFIQQRRSKKVRTILQQPADCQKTLVLDLDETLVHSGQSLEKWDLHIEFEHEGRKREAYTKLRGGLDIFLSVMSQHYELIVFTAGIPDLANKILDQIDSDGLIKHRIFREHCIEVQFSNRIYLKNLNLLNRKMQDVVLFDNSANSGLLNPDNLLVVSSFYQDESDQQLLRLIPFLVHLSTLPDVRNVEQRRIQYFNDASGAQTEQPNGRKRTRKLKTVRMDVQLLAGRQTS